MHYTCIVCILIRKCLYSDSVMTMEKKNYPEVHLEECKYKTKKTKMTKFTKTELESELELKSDTEFESKSELESDSDSEYFFRILLRSLLTTLNESKKL